MQVSSKHFDLLGMKVTDKVTGFKGSVTSLCFDLYGCIQAAVTPKAAKGGALGSTAWFDVTRLTVKGKKPVVELPDYNQGYIAEGRKGADPDRPTMN